jgi:hypothetical protein
METLKGWIELDVDILIVWQIVETGGSQSGRSSFDND